MEYKGDKEDSDYSEYQALGEQMKKVLRKKQLLDDTARDTLCPISTNAER